MEDFDQNPRRVSSNFRNVIAMNSGDLLSLIPDAASAAEGGMHSNDGNGHDLLSQDLAAAAAAAAATAAATSSANTLTSWNPQDGVSEFTAGSSSSNINTTPGIERHRHDLPIPAASPSNVVSTDHTAPTPLITNIRSRKGGIHRSTHCANGRTSRRRKRHNNSTRQQQQQQPQRNLSSASLGGGTGPPSSSSKRLLWWLCCRDRKLVRSTITCMSVLARVLLWCSLLALVAAVVWYSYELKNNGKDPHLIAWFSAGAFVLLGFPISLYGIVMHLANYNQPETQSYIVRILWMVPIYSIQSWLSLRYKDYAVYIETLRDFYESYVLYSFLQYLIQVLGGEESLILMLKDKSPTRGVHMWGLQWFVKPWLMGQPVRKTYMTNEGETIESTNSPTKSTNPKAKTLAAETIDSSFHNAPLGLQPQNIDKVHGTNVGFNQHKKPLKRVHWTSPFFVKCKFGVIQYVLVKLVCSIAVLILERNHLYKEGDFTYKGGYLYICILTNLSQCWALYCLIFFYYATKNELAPINPVGKFLSVKALVFFTWWQSVCISILYQMDLIPTYQSAANSFFGAVTGKVDLNVESYTEPDWSVPLSAENATALDDLGGQAFWPTTGAASGIIEYSPEDVAKAMQDYLICIEMFVAAIVHTFVFPHHEYSPEAVEARDRALNQAPNKNWNKRLGRKWRDWDNKSAWSGTTRSSRDSADIELPKLYSNQPQHELPKDQRLRHRKETGDDDDLMNHPLDGLNEAEAEHQPLLLEGEDECESSSFTEEEGGDDVDFGGHGDVEHGRNRARVQSPVRKKNFVSALLDSTIPQDLRDNTVGIIKGDYVVEKKTLLHHAATSDSYDLFSRFPKRKISVILPTPPNKTDEAEKYS